MQTTWLSCSCCCSRASSSLICLYLMAASSTTSGSVCDTLSSVRSTKRLSTLRDPFNSSILTTQHAYSTTTTTTITIIISTAISQVNPVVVDDDDDDNTEAEILRFFDFQDGGRRHLGFQKFQIVHGRNGQEGQTKSLCQILSKSLKPRPRYVNFNIMLVWLENAYPIHALSWGEGVGAHPPK